jgi:hypothetical protein
MEPSRDDLRQEFRDAFRLYNRAGQLLCAALIETCEASRPEAAEKIRVWQEQLNEARERYEHARAAYVARMLAEVQVEQH